MHETVQPVRLPLNKTSTLFLLDDESVVFSTRSKELYGLDQTATVILFRLEQGETVEGVSLDLGFTGEATLHIQKLAELLAGDEDFTEEYQNELSCPLEPPYLTTGSPCYQLLNTRFAVEGSAKVIEKWITPFIATLQSVEDGDLDLLISIKPDNDKWHIWMNGVVHGDPLSVERLLPVLYAQLRVFAFQKHQRLLTMHGAVITCKSGQTLVLAGRSGTGKSTLAATLLARGFSLVSDEPAVIDSGSGNVLAMPLGLGLKEGSWSILQSEYPQVSHLPTHLRFDGQKICYLLPDSIQVVPCYGRYPATHLIFPEFNPEAAGKLEPLSMVQTLKLFADAGYHIPGLDEERVVGIINWLAGLERYSLVYSSTGEALLQLKEIIT
ncbi:MAG: hypothetical protein WCP20_09815 [Desulfuromonadales bacterium]